MVDVTLYIYSGSALVDGTFYEGDETIYDAITVPGPGDTNYYRVILSKIWATKEIRVDLLGPDTVGYPAITQSDGVQWDIVLFEITIDDGANITMTDCRKFLSSTEKCIPRFPYRVGDTSLYDWSEPKSEAAAATINAYEPIHIKHTGRAQCGVIEWAGGAAASGDVAVTFDAEFSYKPIVNITPLENTAKVMVSYVPSTSGFTLYWKTSDASNKTSIYFQWIAVGPILGGY